MFLVVAIIKIQNKLSCGQSLLMNGYKVFVPFVYIYFLQLWHHGYSKQYFKINNKFHAAFC